jgi:hypothetical protein
VILTALDGAGGANSAVGGEASGAGHTGALLLETRAVCVHTALDGAHGLAIRADGVVVTGQLDCTGGMTPASST